MIDADPATVTSVVGLIYGAAYEPATWPMALDAVRRLFHGSAACVAKSGPDVTPADILCVNNDPEFHSRYLEEFAADNILWQAAQRMPVGAAYSDRTVIEGQTLRRSRIWHEWMVPQDMTSTIGCKLLQAGASAWFVDVERGAGQDEFAAGDVALFGSLTPHLARAAQIAGRLRTAQALTGAFSQLPFGAMLVDSSQHIVASNEAAETILAARGCGLVRRAGRLVAADPAIAAALHRLVVDACRRRDDVAPGVGGDLMVRATDAAHGTPDLALSIGPLMGDQGQALMTDRCAVVFMRSLEPAIAPGFDEQVRALYRLTAQEARLAAALVQGRSLGQAAAEAGIRVSTARSYLEQIFHKTGVRQQSQLVSLLAAMPPSMRQSGPA